MELFRQQQQYQQPQPPSFQAPMAERPPPTAPTQPVMAQIPDHIHSASTTAHREHQRWSRRTMGTPRSSHQSNDAGVNLSTIPIGSSTSNRSTRSLALRLKHKFQGMMNRTPPTTNMMYPPTHPTVAQEFNNHMRTAMLCVVARGLQIPVHDLARSPALHCLMQPYMQWFQQTPPWLQFSGLLLAKKCEQLLQGGGGQGVTDTSGPTMSDPTTIETDVATRDIASGLENTGHWISSPSMADSSLPIASTQPSAYALLEGDDNNATTTSSSSLTPLPPPDEAQDFEFSFADPAATTATIEPQHAEEPHTPVVAAPREEVVADAPKAPKAPRSKSKKQKAEETGSSSEVAIPPVGGTVEEAKPKTIRKPAVKRSLISDTDTAHPTATKAKRSRPAIPIPVPSSPTAQPFPPTVLPSETDHA